MGRAVLVLFAALSAARAFASGMELTASTGTGIIYGVAKELVYSTSAYNGQSYTESELDWALQPLLVGKASLSLRTSIGLAASLELGLGVPLRTGSVSDSDWLNYDVNGDPTRTNYSQQDCFTERAVLLDARVGWEAPLTGWLILQPFLLFEFMDFKWTARDGYAQYPVGYPGSGPPYVPSQVQTPVSGVVIIYEQTWYIPAAGIETTFHAGDFGGTVSFAFSPFAFCSDVDNHLAAAKDFYDTMSNGLLLEPGLSLWWRTGNRRISLDISYRHIGGLLGNTSVVLTGIGKPPGQVANTFANGAGASFDSLNIFLAMTWMP